MTFSDLSALIPAPSALLLAGSAPVTGCWRALVEGGTVRAELGPSAWAAVSGMVTDRFGVTWVLDVPPPVRG